MSDIELSNPSPLEGDVKHIDIKHISVQVQDLVPTPSLTPALTPDEDDLEAMAGKKVFALEKPDDRAKELAAKLTLEEQVCCSRLVTWQCPAHSAFNTCFRSIFSGAGLLFTRIFSLAIILVLSVFCVPLPKRLSIFKQQNQTVLLFFPFGTMVNSCSETDLKRSPY